MSTSYQILIVEDSPTQALRLKLELVQRGWEAICASTADEAMEQIEVRSPDLMVVDYRLPGIGGDELCRRIRMNINTRNIPIIMLTADEAEGTEVLGLDSGADDFFKKSADTEILVLRIGAMLERSQGVQSVLGRTNTHFKRARILAIDDSLTYLAHLGELLGREGYLVQRAASGPEALQLISQDNFDCVLVDLVMPGMDGIEVCRRIVEMRDRFENPMAVLMLTGREGKEDLTRALEAGADDFVGKSSDVAVLKGRIRALLRRKFYQEENQRILEELKNKELEAARARAEKEATEARVAQAGQRQAEAITHKLQQAKAKLERTNNDLVRSNDELKQFAYVASHDLQEPLRSITSFCNLLNESCQGQLDEQANDFIDRIVRAALRMKSLVQDLLSYSRVSQYEQNPFSSVDLGIALEDAIANLQLLINETSSSISHSELPTVIGDRSQLVQILQNLIGNAIKYRGPTSPRIHVDAVRGDKHWEVAVHDNGIGIAQEHHERIFDIFRRLHNNKDFPGTGIGLAVCKKIAQRHRGRIWVESTGEQGSVFRFTIAVDRDADCIPKETCDEYAIC